MYVLCGVYDYEMNLYIPALLLGEMIFLINFLLFLCCLWFIYL